MLADFHQRALVRESLYHATPRAADARWHDDYGHGAGATTHSDLFEDISLSSSLRNASPQELFISLERLLARDRYYIFIFIS